MPALAATTEQQRRGWLPIDDVARRTNTDESNWRHRAVKLAAGDQAVLAPPPSGKGRPIWWFDPRCDARLYAEVPHDRQEIASLSGRYPAHVIERAAGKLRWLREYLGLCATQDKRTAARRTVKEAKQIEGVAFRIGARTLQHWEYAYRKQGIDGLVDRRGRAEGTESADVAQRSPAGMDYFYSLYHAPQRPTVKMCHDATRRQSVLMGWRWAPSAAATTKWLKRYDDFALTSLLRHGHAPYQHQHMTYLEQDYEKLAPGEQYVCDHHQLKTFCRYKGKAIRPWYTAVEDARTRIIVGWHLGPSPHSDAILASLKMAFVTWGVPQKIKIDNGKDYASKTFVGLTKQQLRRLRREFPDDWKERIRAERDRVDCTPGTCPWFGLIPELGCELKFALPYSPWSKLIERFFRTLTDGYTRTRAAFCDTSPERKGDGLKEIVSDLDALPTLDDEAAAIGQWLEIYHSAPSLADGMHGQGPREVWSSMVSVARIAEAGELDLLCNVLGSYKVGPNGVTVTVAGAKLSYGQWDHRLRALRGRQVLVAVDRHDLSTAVILTGDERTRKVLCRVKRNDRFSPAADANSDEMREAQHQAGRERKKIREAQASAAGRRRTADQRIAEDRRRQVAELRATGTHGRAAAHPDQTIRVLATGIEGLSTASRPPVEPPSIQAFDVRDLIDDGDDVGPVANTDRFSIDDLCDDDGPVDAPRNDTSVFDFADDDGTDQAPVIDRFDIEDLL